MRINVCCVILLAIIRIDAQSLNLHGYVENIYGYGDNVPTATQFYNPTYTPSSERIKSSQFSPGLSQYQQLSSPSQDTPYSQYVSPPHSPQHSYGSYRFNPQPSHKIYQSPSETIITPVQHSTVIHHTPYISSISSQSPPFVGKLLYLNGKSPHVHVQPLQQPPGPLQHPLQKPLHYQQQPQKFYPSQQIYPHSQGQFLPIRNPAPPAQVQYINTKPQPPAESSSSNAAENEDEKESEDIEEENEDSDDSEEKGELNEENEDDEDSEEVERYRDEEEDDEEKEDRPKYTNYSFHFHSPQTKPNNQQKHKESEDDEEEEDDHRGGYRTHENVEEDEEEDSNEDSSRLNYNKYNKKVPKNYTKFAKYEKRPQNKYAYKPTNDKKFDYERYTFTTSRPEIKHRDHQKRYKQHYRHGDAEGRPSKHAPTTTKHMYREKWFIMKKI